MVGTRRWEEKATDSESWVRIAPRVFPTAAPSGAPAAKVANAMDLIFDGGNAWASIPSYCWEDGLPREWQPNEKDAHKLGLLPPHHSPECLSERRLRFHLEGRTEMSEGRAGTKAHF